MRKIQLASLFIFGCLASSSSFALTDFNFLPRKPLLFAAMLNNSTTFTNSLELLHQKPSLSQYLYLGGITQGAYNRIGSSSPVFYYTNNKTYSKRNYYSVDRIAVGIVGSFASMLTGYLEVGSADVGEPYVSKSVVNQAYALFGDGVAPYYAFAGLKNVEFGRFATVNIFAQPITRWDFAGTAMSVGGGYASQSLNLSGTVFKGGSQGVEDYYGAGLWRVHNYTNYYTSRGPNYALNASYTVPMGSTEWSVGGGYLHGLWLGNPSNGFIKSTVGAWDLNTQFMSKSFIIMAELVQSRPKVASYGTFNTNGAKASLKAWDVGFTLARSNFIVPNESRFHADLSGVVGNGSFAQTRQLVLGVDNQVSRELKAGIEYVIENQRSGTGALRSGIFYRQHQRVHILRLDFVAAL